MRRAILPALLLALAPLAAGAQTLFKCVQDGRTVYQSEPCPGKATQGTLKVEPRAAGGGSAGGGDVDRAMDVMSSYRACADAVSIWGQEMRGPYAEWRSRNAAAVARIENDRELQRAYQERLKAKRSGKASMCREAAETIRTASTR